MKAKRFLSVFITVALCVTNFTVFAKDDVTEEIFVIYAPAEDYGSNTENFTETMSDNGSF